MTDNVMQRPMQNMSDGVMALDRAPAREVKPYCDTLADSRRVIPFNQMNKRRAGFLRIRDFPLAIFSHDLAGIADLTAHLGVAHRIVHDHAALFGKLDNSFHLRFGVI
jgi:hypothetical protein